MAGTERGSGTQYRRGLAALAAVLVVGGASLTSPTVFSSHSAPPSTVLPTMAQTTPESSPVPPTPTSHPTPTVQGTSDPGEGEPTESLPTVTPVTPTPTATMTSVVTITTKRITVPFATISKEDPTLAKGKKVVVRAGVKGLNELTYTDGKLTKTKVIKKPVSKLVSIGTKPAEPWLSDKQCGDRHNPFVRVTVNDPDKVGYRLTLTWYKSSQVYTQVGTNTFEFRPPWGWWWGPQRCDATLG